MITLSIFCIVTALLLAFWLGGLLGYVVANMMAAAANSDDRQGRRG